MHAKTIVFVHPFLLHYHYPRLAALATECHNTGISFHNIQLAGHVKTYDSLISEFKSNFNNHCLFNGTDLFQIPQRELWSALSSKLKKLKPDAVFLYGYSMGINRQAKQWTEKNNVASILISDSNYLDTRRYALFEFLKTLFVSRFEAAFVGGTNSSLYLQRLGLPLERIVPGYDVVDNETIRLRDEQNKRNLSLVRTRWHLPEKYFLFVGRLVECKNVSGLLTAYTKYSEACAGSSAPWGLAICGDGPADISLREQVKRMPEPFRKNVRFHGLVKQPELIDFFSCAACLILPSTKYESWGLVVNEALVCSLPVIITDRCGCSADLVKDGVNGWLFDPYNPDELAARMLAMHQLDPKAHTEMGLRGQALISEWGLSRFCQGALQSAEIALRHSRSVH